jgi:hypothetical protein
MWSAHPLTVVPNASGLSALCRRAIPTPTVGCLLLVVDAHDHFIGGLLLFVDNGDIDSLEVDTFTDDPQPLPAPDSIRLPDK